jgi:hypothetical protein
VALKNPFEVPAKPGGRRERKASGERLIGQPIENFTLEDQAYVREQLKAWARNIAADPRSEPFIWQMILADLRHQRLQARVSEIEGDPESDEREARLGPVRRAAKEAWDSYLKTREILGDLPEKAKVERTDCLTDLHLGYVAEVAARAKRSDTVGRPSAAAQQLATSRGLDARRFVADAMPEAERLALIKSIRGFGGGNAADRPDSG